jgi:CheY-specific phosphatase CheX
MNFDRTILPRIMKAVVWRTCNVLERECAITVTETSTELRDIEVLALHEATIIVGIGGAVSLLIAFSFRRRLLDRMCDRYTHGIDISDHGRDFYLKETAAEIVNTIVGLCMGDFHDGTELITLSPPAIIDQARSIRRPRHAVFSCVTLKSASGSVDINFVGPRHLFDERLNPVAKGA